MRDSGDRCLDYGSRVEVPMHELRRHEEGTVMANLCLTCQRPTTDDDPRCASCQRAQRIARYSPNWQRQSRQAIARAPWCALCSGNEGLTTDHVPGVGIRVLCGACDSGSRTTRRDRDAREVTDGERSR